MSPGTPHFSKSPAAFSRDLENNFASLADALVSANSSPVMPAGYFGDELGAEHLEESLDANPPDAGPPEVLPSLVASPLALEGLAFDGERVGQEYSQSPESSLLLPRRLVSSRPTSRVAAQVRRETPNFRPEKARWAVAIRTQDLEQLAQEWFDSTLDSGQSPRTVELRKMLIARLGWFLRQAHHDRCGAKEITLFFRHLRTGHTLPKGRWGEGAANRGKQPLRPATMATYDRHFRSFFNFLVAQHFLPHSPMDAMERQKDSADQIEPYTLEQIKAYIASAQRSKYPKRNEAVVRFLLDTGVRASELCGLKMGDMDLFGRRARVLGKGNRNRIVSWGRCCGMALRAYVRDEYFAPDQYKPTDPLFITATGKNAGEALTYTGLRLLVQKLGRRGGIQIARCSPHTFRHTFAIWFLRRGGEMNTLQMILGHNSLKATQIYVKYGQADFEQKQRQYAPGDILQG
jgi:site-specific recombinase XerD